MADDELQDDLGNLPQNHPVQGTIFFWGVDSKGRKIPLMVEENDSGTRASLCGLDDRGQLLSIPFTAAEILRGLEEGRLLPSIFTSYLLVVIARGVGCVGGYYQAGYLPIMRKAVEDVLHNRSAESTVARELKKSPPDLYLSGMQAIALKVGDKLLPAGPLEIIASGGLDPEQCAKMGQMTLRQAHLVSLHDTIEDAVPTGSELDRTKSDILRLVSEELGEEVVTISID